MGWRRSCRTSHAGYKLVKLTRDSGYYQILEIKKYELLELLEFINEKSINININKKRD